MEKINFNHLYYFNAIAQAGRISAAAQALKLSSSTLSEQLGLLEESFGHQLFTREGTHLTLTEEGKRMFQYTKVMFRAGERLARAFDATPTDERVRLIIGVASSISKAFTARYLKQLLRDRQVVVEVRQGDYEYLMKDLCSFQLDILVNDQPHEQRGFEQIVTENVFSSEVVLVRGAARDDITHSYLAGKVFPCIGYPAHFELRWMMELHFEQEDRHPEYIAEMEDVSLMRHAALEGAGAALLPKVMVESDIASGTLTVIDSLPHCHSQISLSYRQSSPLEHVLRAVRILKGSIGETE